MYRTLSFQECSQRSNAAIVSLGEECNYQKRPESNCKLILHNYTDTEREGVGVGKFVENS